jgi:hypothetical protein
VLMINHPCRYRSVRMCIISEQPTALPRSRTCSGGSSALPLGPALAAPADAMPVSHKIQLIFTDRPHKICSEAAG